MKNPVETLKKFNKKPIEILKKINKKPRNLWNIFYDEYQVIIHFANTNYILYILYYYNIDFYLFFHFKKMHVTISHSEKVIETDRKIVYMKDIKKRKELYGICR